MGANKGFTLIELIIVIVILGIIAVTAAPRILNLQTDAEIAVLQGVEGALKSAALVTYSKANVQGQTGETGTVELDPTDITTRYGFSEANYNRSLRHTVDLTDVTVYFGSQNSSVQTQCPSQLCIVQNLTSTRFFGIGGTGLSSAEQTQFGLDYADSRVSVVFAKGFSAQQRCYVYYVEAASSSLPAVVGFNDLGCRVF